MSLGSYVAKRSQYGNGCVRQHPRYLFAVPVTLRRLLPGGFDLNRGVTLDLSQGGIGAMMQRELRVGEAVEIDLALPARSLNILGIVRYSSDTRSGLEFLGLTGEEKQQIAEVTALLSTNRGETATASLT